MRVSARRVAIVAGLVAGVYLAMVFSVRRVPDRVLQAIGGPGGVARDGGLILRYRPPEGYDAAKFEQSLARRGATIRRDAGRIVLEVPGVGQGEADDIAGMLTHGGLQFREVIEDLGLMKAPHETVDREDFVAPGVRVALDQWYSESGGDRHLDSYLSAAHRPQLAAAFEQLASQGWKQPPHTIIAYEALEPDPAARDQRVEWRSYLLGDEVLLDGDAVEHAVPSADPNTDRPIVLLDFDRAGGQRFGEITARLVGHKLATLVGGRVKSAPIINSAIRGGRASITMGGGDLARQEREAAALAAAFETVALPAGGVVEQQTWVPPARIATFLARARLGIGLVGGALVALLVWITLRVARPVWQPPVQHPIGPFPLRRVAVTLLAPLALLVLEQIPWPGVNDVELAHILTRGGSRDLHLTSVAMLGVGPIVSAYILVELVTLVRSRWSRMRFQPAGRIRIGRWVAGLGIGFALIQSHLAVRYLAELGRFGAEVLEPGVAAHLAAMASLTTGTILLVIVAGMIRQHGLGNGYSAVIVSGWAIPAARRFLEGPSAGFELGVVTLAAIGCATVAMLRMRIGEDREVPLRVPSSGSVPLSSAGAVVALWSLARSGLDGFAWGLGGSPPGGLGASWYPLAALLAAVPLWSLAFSRPAILAPLAAHSPLAPPSPASWRRATLLSLVFLMLIAAGSLGAAMTDGDARIVGDAAVAMLAAAFALDLVDDLRARRADLVAVWPLQHAQHAELVRRVLGDAGIECHLQASHVRTLLAFFGPYVPIDVLVPAAAAEDARARIEPVFRDAAVGPVDPPPEDRAGGGTLARALRPGAG